METFHNIAVRDVAQLSLKNHRLILGFCRKIKNGLIYRVETKRMKVYAQHFWTRYMKQHFLQEETILFASTKNAEVRRALNEHLKIAEQMDALDSRQYFSAARFSALADAVNNHVQYEEREVFPDLGRELSNIELQKLKAEMTALQQDISKDDFPDKFWLHERSCYTGF